MLGSLIASEGTALYDAILEAKKHCDKVPNPAMISAVVVLSDGADSGSRTSLQSLLQSLQADAETGGLRVFTIGYGKDAKGDVLEQISKATRAKYFKGTPENIESVFRQISTFF
jgi:Ca-activated chloride channel family protein